MIYLPVIGALMEAVGMILEKKVLRSRKIDYRNYTVYEFLAIVIVLLPFAYFFWKIDAGAWAWKNILLFAFVIIMSVLANLLIFYSLKREKVTEFEPIWLMQPLFTILLAFIFYGNERNWIIMALALIASISLVASHVKKHHLVFDKYIVAALLGSFFFAVELVASKPILQYYNPFAFYFIRCFFIFAIALALYRPNGNGLNKRVVLMTLIIGAMWAVYRAIIYYGYENLGIVFTTILFILSPVFIFLFAVLFLKEKPNWRQIVSTIIIVACVALAVYFEAV